MRQCSFCDRYQHDLDDDGYPYCCGEAQQAWRMERECDDVLGEDPIHDDAYFAALCANLEPYWPFADAFCGDDAGHDNPNFFPVTTTEEDLLPW